MTPRADVSDPAPDRASGPTLGGVVRSGEFRRLWLAGAQSLIGDQLARVALSILVFNQTKSGLATATVYALTFLPALAGNILLGAIADRMPRRNVLVLGDLGRGVLLAAMAIPRVPLYAVALLLTVAVLLGAPWKAAEAALVSELMAENDYPLAVGLRTATLQTAQILGFAVGGLIVAGVGARDALALDAATFFVSALVIRLGIRPRPGPAAAAPGRSGWLMGVRTVLGDRTLRQLLGFSSILGLLVVPEGLAAPYAAALGGGPRTTGLLLTAIPAGVLVGSVIFSRWVPATTRASWLGPLAVLSGLPLVACSVVSGLVATMALWAISGAATAYQVQVITEYVWTSPAVMRVQAIGLASAALLAAQGIGLLIGGVAALLAGVTAAVVLAGAAASVSAVFLTVARSRLVPALPR